MTLVTKWPVRKGGVGMFLAGFRLLFCGVGLQRSGIRLGNVSIPSKSLVYCKTGGLNPQVLILRTT